MTVNLKNYVIPFLNLNGKRVRIIYYSLYYYLENLYFTKDVFRVGYILLEVYIISWANLFETKRSKRKKIPLKILIESDLSKSKVSLFRKRIADWNVIRATVIEFTKRQKETLTLLFQLKMNWSKTRRRYLICFLKLY